MQIPYRRFKKNIDFWLKYHGLSFWLTQTKQIVMDCPFCKRKGKLYFGVENSLGICFVCGWRGDFLYLVQQVDEISHREAFYKITKGIGEDRNTYLQGIKYQQLERGGNELVLSDKKIEVVEMPFRFRNFQFTQMDIARYQRFYQYLIKRGITREMVTVFDIRFDPTNHRLIFPIYFKNKLVGWQGRLVLDHLITPRNPKALTEPKGYCKSDYLFGYDRVCQSDFITIVEGPIDALKTFPYNSIALFGKTLSQYHVNLIRGMPKLKRIYMALDPEEAKATQKLNYNLSSYYETWKLNIPMGTDCGDKTIEEINNLFRQAKPYDFLELPKNKCLQIHT